MINMNQFVDDYITHHINKDILDFFNIQNPKHKFIVGGIHDFIAYIMEGYVSSEYDKVTRAVRDKKRYYSKVYNQKLTDVAIEDVTHPLYYVTTLPAEVYGKLYGTKSYEEIIEDAVTSLNEWKSNNRSLLIHYPGIEFLSEHYMTSFLELDVKLDIHTYINTHLKGDINNCARLYPSALLDKPLFGPSSYTLIMEEMSSGLHHSILLDDDSHLDIIPNDGANSPFKSLTRNEVNVMSALLRRVDNMVNFMNDYTVKVPLRTLAKDLLDYMPSSVNMEHIENYCLNLANYTFSYKSPKTKLKFSLMDHVSVSEENGEKIVTARFGSISADAVLTRKLISVSSHEYSLLNDKLAQIICYVLKREQILHKEQRLGVVYTPSFFFNNISFEKNRGVHRKNNLAAICNALEDYVRAGVIIEKYTFINDKFTIDFKPLSHHELEDFSANPFLTQN